MSDEDDAEESWLEFFENNRSIPIHGSHQRQNAAKIFPFCLTLRRLELGTQIGTEFQFRLTFYDAANHWFFGNTWIGPVLNSQQNEEGICTIDIDEPLYFCSSLNEFTTIVVIELVNISETMLTSVGWSWIRVFSQIESITDVDETARPQEKRLDFYHGTPAALLHMPEPIEEFPQLTKCGQRSMTYVLQTHEALDKVVHLIPENIVVSGDDIIPGISETTDDSDVIDILRSPSLIRTWPLHLTKVSIDMLPSVEKFEEVLCSMINEDRLIKDGLQPDGGVVSIAERKLKVGIHNGWKFVKPPQILYLEPVYSETTPSRRASLRPGSGLSNTTKECTGLALSSRLELNECVHHHLFSVIFQLEYVVNIPVSQPEIPSGKKARNRLGSTFGSIPLAKKMGLVLRTAVWIPFENGKINNGLISLELDGGAVEANPFNDLTFIEVYDFPDDLHFDSLGKIEFVLHQARIKKGFEVAANAQSHQLHQPPVRNNYTYPSRSSVNPMLQSDASVLASGRPPLPPNAVFSPAHQLPEARMQAQQVQLMSSQQYVIQQQQQQQQMLPLSPAQMYQAQNLTELPKSQLYTPLVVSSMESPKPVPMSRVAHSLLYSVPYPQVVDTQGSPPFIVDPTETVKYELARENRDPLHANQIILQFLAVAGCSHRTVFFTFQFYRFPQTTTERMFLQEVEGTEQLHGDIPCVLQKSTRDGRISKNSRPGLMINYTIDPSFLQPGEKLSFLKYLLQQRLYIDMWDGDSLMLIGSTSIELKHLLRQGQSAVQVSQELDIVFVEYAEDDALLAGDAMQRGLPHHSGVTMSLEGKLFMRFANIGCYPDTNDEKLKEMPKSFHSTIVEPNSTMHLNGHSSKSQQYKSPLKTTAKLMSDVDTELATVLLTRKDGLGKTKNMKENDINAVRKRKMDRMLAVRQLQGGEDVSPFLLQKEEKVQRTRDLKTIQLYRLFSTCGNLSADSSEQCFDWLAKDNLLQANQNIVQGCPRTDFRKWKTAFRERYKSNNIHAKLEESITTHHMIHSSLGRAEFFEFKLKNPYPNDLPININFSDNELSVITDTREWQHYKTLTDVDTALEEQMFSAISDEGVKLFLRAKEAVYIPFKFQCFTSQHVTPEMGPTHPLYTKSNEYKLQTFGKDTTLSSKDIKVTFRGLKNKPIAILIVHVELHPHTINQTFRFYHPEQTFLKKAVRLPPLHTLPGSAVGNGRPIKVVAKCSDDGAICETHQVQAGEPQDIFIKVPCGLSPQVNRFFVVVFIDEYCSSPCQIWQFYVHSLQRIDINATEGQPSKLSLVLKGTKTSRMVRCHTSHPNELEVLPTDHFMLMANGVQELTVTLDPRESGKRMMFLNVVDEEFHQLIKSWLVMATCSPPVINKAFEVNLKLGGGPGSNKRISFTNPYPVKKHFYFKTNHPELLTFKDNGVLLGGGESHNICLCFLPQHSVGAANINIFINDRDGKNEEAFCVRANYFKEL